MARERKRGRPQLPNHTQSTSQIGLRKRTHNRIQNKIAQRALAYDSLSLIDLSVIVHGHSMEATVEDDCNIVSSKEDGTNNSSESRDMVTVNV